MFKSRCGQIVLFIYLLTAIYLFYFKYIFKNQNTDNLTLPFAGQVKFIVD